MSQSRKPAATSPRSNLVPRDAHAICQYYREGHPSESDTLQLHYLSLIESLFSDINPIPIKQAMNDVGYSEGRCR